MRFDLAKVPLLERRRVANKLDEVYSRYPSRGGLAAYRVSHGEGEKSVGSFCEIQWAEPITRRVTYLRFHRWLPKVQEVQPQGLEDRANDASDECALKARADTSAPQSDAGVAALKAQFGSASMVCVDPVHAYAEATRITELQLKLQCLDRRRGHGLEPTYDVVTGRVGEGTFGIVRTAKRKADGVQVAIKECSPDRV